MASHLLPTIQIGSRTVGGGAPCFVIAEAGVNHGGSIEQAHRLVDVAADAGADAVKFQTFRTERLVTRAAPKAAYQKETTGDGEGQWEMLSRLELSPAAHEELQRHCVDRDILFLSTPFDEESLALLDRLGVPAIKLGSGEVTNHLLLRAAARTGRPLLASTGMAWLGEVDAMVRCVRDAGCSSLALFHCVSGYPADPADTNLRAMDTLAAAFGVPVGLSDHTVGATIALAAVARGAALFEKHFTLDRTLPGPDHRASLEPGELADMIRGIRAVESALGTGLKAPTAAEQDTRAVARRSLAAAVALPSGTTLAEAHLTALRPASGIAPDLLDHVIGRRLRAPVAEGALLTWADLE